MGQLKVKSIGIQLALIDDVKKKYDELQAARIAAGDQLQKAQNAGVLISQSGNVLKNKADEFSTLYANFLKLAQNLGLEVPSNLASFNSAAKMDLKTAATLVKNGSTIQNLAKV